MYAKYVKYDIVREKLINEVLTGQREISKCVYKKKDKTWVYFPMIIERMTEKIAR